MHVFFCVSKNVSVSCAYTQGKREQFSGFNRTLDAINNVFRKFSAFHDETGRLNVDGMNIISNDGSNSLHFHAVHFMRTLPTGSVDPNFGRRVRNRRQLNSLQNTWPYGYSMPIAVRYTQDAFSRSGWLWPVDAKGEPLKATSYM